MPAFDAVGSDAVGSYDSTTQAPVTVNLTATNSSETASSGTGAATVTPAIGTVNLTAASSTETGTSGSGAATVTPASSVVNLVAANSSETATSGTGAATVTSTPKIVNLVALGSAETGTSGTGAVTVTSSNSQAGTSMITVPASRTAVFAGKSRVAVFTDSGPVKLAKVIADQLYIVGDFTKPLTDGATTAQSVAIVNSNATVLEDPVAQGSLMVAKIGMFDPAGGQFTFRVTCANGEVIDGTVILTALDDRSQVFGKDPDEHRAYAFDVSADLALSANTTIATIQTPVAIGVSALSVPAIQGGKAVVLIGGLDLSDGAVNSCPLVMTLGTGEVINRAIYFGRQDH